MFCCPLHIHSRYCFYFILKVYDIRSSRHYKVDGNNGYESFNNANQGMVQSHRDQTFGKRECSAKIHFNRTGKCRDETGQPCCYETGYADVPGYCYQTLERIKTYKPTDYSHIENVGSHGGDTSIAKKHSLYNQYEHQNEDCSKR